MTVSSAPLIERLDVAAYRIPTDTPEADGTLQWAATTLVLVQLTAGDGHGIGYSYADAARCAGISGFVQCAALCEAYGLPLSAHCAPALHLHPACALPALCHIEYFHDHVRIEAMLFDGVSEPVAGMLRPDPTRPGLGLELRCADAAPYRI